MKMMTIAQEEAVEVKVIAEVLVWEGKVVPVLQADEADAAATGKYIFERSFKQEAYEKSEN